MVQVNRKTKETDIKVATAVYGSGEIVIDTNIAFFNHMLESFAKHACMDLEVYARGDIDVDYHHSVEDVGIVIAEALRKDIFPVSSVERFGSATVLMDEASVTCDIDLSNRAYLFFDLKVDGNIGSFNCELVEEFFRAFAFNLGITVHIVLNRGKNMHHIVEASFKALGVALRRAVTKNSVVSIPSTKGVL